MIRFPPIEGLRPTPDRVRETLFNWLGQDLTDLTVLDLFAGSGALALEALSRGAKLAVAVETHAEAIRALRTNAAALGARIDVVRGDALRFLKADPRRFDVIFIDPPFSEPWWLRLAPLLDARAAIGGWIYVEQGESIEPPAGWLVHRQRQAGHVHYHLLRRRDG